MFSVFFHAVFLWQLVHSLPSEQCRGKGSRKKIKVIFFSGPATKRGGAGVRAWPLRKKNFFRSSKKIPTKSPPPPKCGHKARGGGGEGVRPSWPGH